MKQSLLFDHHLSLQLSVPDNFFAEDQESPPLCFFFINQAQYLKALKQYRSDDYELGSYHYLG